MLFKLIILGCIAVLSIFIFKHTSVSQEWTAFWTYVIICFINALVDYVFKYKGALIAFTNAVFISNIGATFAIARGTDPNEWALIISTLMVVGLLLMSLMCKQSK